MTDAPSMAGKYVLVTSGTDSIGKATAARLAALGTRAVITAAPRLPRPISALQRAAGLRTFRCDMSAQAEVRRPAALVLGTYRQPNVLVNNVGGF